LIKPGKPWRS
ncbi:hypothetical protein LDH14_18435, partial [Mycobacterium tuberculosis]